MGLALPAVIIAGVATLCAYALTLHYGPQSVRAFKELQWTVRNDVSQVLLREGTFNQVGKGLTVYVRDRAPDGTLRGVLLIANEDDADFEVTAQVYAEELNKHLAEFPPTGKHTMANNINSLISGCFGAYALFKQL